MKISKILGFAGVVSAMALSLASCKKEWLDVRPTDKIVAEDVFKDIAGARSLVNGIARIMYESTDHNTFGVPSLALMWDLMGEDFGMSAGGSGWFVSAWRYTDARNPGSTGSYQWSYLYRIVNNANWLIANIDAIEAPQSEKDELKGQALAYRAWAYYNLASAYQFNYKNNVFVVANGSARTGALGPNASTTQALGVPLYTEPTKVANPRASLEEVYTQMRSDIKTSYELLSNAGITRNDKSQINANVAAGIYARIALSEQDWTNAAKYAEIARSTAVLNRGESNLNGFNEVNNAEWIWGSVINAEQNGVYASFLSHMVVELEAYGSTAQKKISKLLIDGQVVQGVTIIEPLAANDIRRQWFVPFTGTTPTGYVRGVQKKFKAKVPNSFVGDFPLMRAPEMYLIEAEAKAQSGNLAGATTILEEYMKTRQDDYAFTAANRNALVQEIWRQRRVELWGEGFRLFDIKRQMAPFSGGVVSLAKMDRNGSTFPSGWYSVGSIDANDVRFNFRIPGGENNINTGSIQNP